MWPIVALRAGRRLRRSLRAFRPLPAREVDTLPPGLFVGPASVSDFLRPTPTWDAGQGRPNPAARAALGETSVTDYLGDPE